MHERWGFNTVSAISERRIVLAKASAFETEPTGQSVDVGFRKFALIDSNFSKWHVDSDSDETHLEQHLLDLRDSVDDEATPEAILTELLLKQGYSLTEQIGDTEVDGLKLKSVGDGLVLAYLDEHTKPTLQQLRAVLDSEDFG